MKKERVTKLSLGYFNNNKDAEGVEEFLCLIWTMDKNYYRNNTNK